VLHPILPKFGLEKEGDGRVKYILTSSLFNVHRSNTPENREIHYGVSEKKKGGQDESLE